MTGLHGKVSGYQDTRRKALSSLHAQATTRQPAARQGIRGSLSMLGMAIGYLGLVVILSMAPFWNLSVAPYQGQAHVCTEFGGSR